LINALVTVTDNNELVKLLGTQDRYLALYAKRFGIKIFANPEGLLLSGTQDRVTQAEDVIKQVLEIIRRGYSPSYEELVYMVENYGKSSTDFRQLFREEVLVTPRGKKIFAKTTGQLQYLRSIKEKDLVFGIGPAGTGKTYLAVATAVKALKEKKIEKIILTRPAIEAGERLGFLPGDLQDKVDPYLRPLYDALLDFLGLEVYQRFMEKGIIEVAPLAYMRGRTLNDAYIILDEAQNTTPAQMKMFLTRFGFGSKVIVTGDVTQVDLPKETQSGLSQAVTILQSIEGIGIVHLDESDIIRHRLVADIVRAYSAYQSMQRGEANAK
jgi:phosphate starvation-inducible PhoH-like protein